MPATRTFVRPVNIRIGHFIALAVVACMHVQAENGTWDWFTEGYTNGLSVEAAADWNDTANWVGGVVPEGDSATAYIVPSDRTSSMASFPARWIKVPEEGLSLGYLSTRQAAKVYLLGGPISFAKTSSYHSSYGALRDETANSAVCPVWIYNTLTFPDQSANNTGTLINRVNICAPVICPPSARVQISSDYRHYMNRYATSTSEMVVDEGVTGRLSPGSGNVRLFARMGAPEQTGVWKTVSGSPYLRRVGVEHDLAAGCTVTGPGIPAGAFLRRIFAKDLVEISANATADSGDDGATLTFGEFHPTTIQHLKDITCQGADKTQITWYFTKFRAEDTFRIVVTNFMGGAANNWFIITSSADASDNFATNRTTYPGTLVLQNTSSFKTQLLRLNKAHIEFTGTNGTHFAGINRIQIDGAARITAPESVTATVHNVEAWTSALTKDGSGTLYLNSTNATHGALSVEEGTFFFSPTYSKGTPTMSSLTVAAGATFTLAAGTSINVTSAPSLASGARIVVEKGARLVLPAAYSLPADVSFEGEGAVVSLCSTGGIDYEPIRTTPSAGAVVGNPAFWVTAESLTNDVPAGTIVEEDGTKFVTRLNDCRGGADQGYHFCTNVYNRPWLVTSGTVPYIQFKTGASGGSESANNYGLAWDVPLTNIRVVFAVLSSPSSGMGCLLGATKRLTPCDYLRGSTGAGSNIFYWNGSGSSPNVHDAPIYRNGVEIKYNSNYNGCSDTTIIEVDTLADTSADAFSICNSGTWGKRWDLCGGRLVEYIIYTNALTYAERLQVSDYLMMKWRGERSVHKFADQRQRMDVTFPEGGATYALDVAEGEAMTAISVEAGGTLAKTGAGTLHLIDYSDVTGSLRVDEGTVVVQSVDPSTLALPSGAYLHLDASADSTLTKTTSGGITRVTAWSDPDGGLTATLRYSTSTNAPRLVENALNNLPVLDFGHAHVHANTAAGYKSSPCYLFTPSWNLHTIFSVQGSRGGGNTILGGTAGRNDSVTTRKADATYKTIGIWRDVQAHPGDPSLPLVTTSGNTSSQMSSVSDTSKTEFRKDGVVVNQKTEPMGGGYNLYSIKTLTAHNLESDIIGGIHYGRSCGGMELGEIAYYERVLTADEFADAESHLMYKWFNRGSAYRRPAVVGTLSVSAGATLSLFGGAPVTASAISGEGTVDGDLKAAVGGCSITAVVAADGTIAPLVVTGAFDVSAGGVVTLVGAVEALKGGDYPVVSAGSVVGTAAGWTCVCANEHYKFLVRVSGGDLVVSVVMPGTVLIMK